MNENYINSLIEKFWNGSASEQEVLHLYDLLQEYIEIENNVRFEQASIDKHLLNNDKAETILKIINESIEESKKNKLSIIYSKNYKIRALCAAAIILFVFCSVFIFKGFKNEKIEQKNIAVTTLKIDSILNRSSKIKRITLPDKSTVLLHPNSSIFFEHNFRERNVWLQGKAYFTVIHDEKKVFSVTTGEIITTDIGTEFEIDASRKRNMIIHLLAGKIRVGKTLKSKLTIEDKCLNPGEILKINTESGRLSLIKPVVKPSKISNKPQLIFNKTPLNVVFKSISQKYNTTIIFKDEQISKLTFTGNIESENSLFNILNTICYMNNLQCSSQPDGTYKISQN